MSLHIKSDGINTRIQFVLPDDIHDGPVKFRYLGAGGVWFDEEDADAITPEGSLINA
jgi:hypothetical protein